MRRYHPALVIMATLTLALSACQSSGGGTTSTSSVLVTTTSTLPATTTSGAPSTTSTSQGQMGVVAYFLLEELEADAGGPFLVPVYRDVTANEDLAVAALEALMTGPTEDEQAGTPAISSAIPEATTVLAVEMDGTLARVDFSEIFDDGGGSFSMFARLAQVVYTLTRIDGIEEVEFLIEGEPVSVFSSEGIELDSPQERSDYYDLLPPIFTDYPAWGEPVTSPVQARGLSNVFEAVSQVMLTDDDGLPLFEDSVMATCGTGCWGEWEVHIPYTIDREQFGALIVWESSARDGDEIHVREYPVLLG